MRRHLHALAAGIAVGLAVTAASPARADGVTPSHATPVQREQAQARFARGKDLMGRKDYEGALAEFRASHEIVSSPNTRLEIARCLLASGHDVAAYAEFGRAAVEAKELLAEDNRYDRTYAAATAERNDLQPRLAFVSLKIDNATDATRVTVGGEEIRRAAWSEPAPVATGTTPIRVETPGHAAVERSVTLAAGGSTSLTIDAQSGAETAPAPPAAVADVAPPTPPNHLRPWAYVAGGVGAAGLVSFAVFGSLARSSYNDLQSACPNGACPSSRTDDINAGKTRQTLANVSLAVGIVGVATGVTLFILSRPKPSAPQTAVVVSPTWLGIQGTL